MISILRCFWTFSRSNPVKYFVPSFVAVSGHGRPRCLCNKLFLQSHASQQVQLAQLPEFNGLSRATRPDCSWHSLEACMHMRGIRSMSACYVTNHNLLSVASCRLSHGLHAASGWPKCSIWSSVIAGSGRSAYRRLSGHPRFSSCYLPYLGTCSWKASENRFGPQSAYLDSPSRTARPFPASPWLAAWRIAQSHDQVVHGGAQSPP